MTKKTAIITGAASGIGLALTDALTTRGYHVIAADIDKTRLAELQGDDITPYTLDVSDFVAMQAFAAFCQQQSSQIELVFNNAGVMSIGPIAEQSIADIRRVIDINYFGLLHGVKAFLPVLTAQDSPSRIVNTASLSGLVAAPFLGAYSASKYAAIALSETLHFELEMMRSKVKVSVMTPGGVKTDIMQLREGFNASERMRQTQAHMHQAAQNSSMPAADFAKSVLEQIDDGKFWIITHPVYNDAIRSRIEGLLAQDTPEFTAWDTSGN